MTREERERIRKLNNEEGFKALASAVIRDTVTDYVSKARMKNSRAAHLAAGAVMQYMKSKDFEFWCDVIDFHQEDIVNSSYLNERIAQVK